jgi:hypothetical protein
LSSGAAYNSSNLSTAPMDTPARAIHGFLYDDTNNELYRFVYMNPSVVGSLAKFVITVEKVILNELIYFIMQ